MKLWLSEVGRDKIGGIKAIRHLGDYNGIGMEGAQFRSLAGAKATWEKVAKGTHVLMCVTDDAEVMREATRRLDSSGDLRYQITPDDVMPQEPQDPAGDSASGDPIEAGGTDGREATPTYVPTVEATQCAAFLLAANNGVPGSAVVTARNISRVLQAPFWEDVAEYILRTFMADNESLAVLLAARETPQP